MTNNLQTAEASDVLFFRAFQFGFSLGAADGKAV